MITSISLTRSDLLAPERECLRRLARGSAFAVRGEFRQLHQRKVLSHSVVARLIGMGLAECRPAEGHAPARIALTARGREFAGKERAAR